MNERLKHFLNGKNMEYKEAREGWGKEAPIHGYWVGTANVLAAPRQIKQLKYFIKQNLLPYEVIEDNVNVDKERVVYLKRLLVD